MIRRLPRWVAVCYSGLCLGPVACGGDDAPFADVGAGGSAGTRATTAGAGSTVIGGTPTGGAATTSSGAGNAAGSSTMGGSADNGGTGAGGSAGNPGSAGSNGSAGTGGAPPALSYKPRVIDTTDLGADPDDEESMVRQLVSASEFDLEGLVVATSCWKKSQSSTAMLDKIVGAYAEAYPNLSKHAAGFPTPEYLKSISVLGQKGYGMADVGAGKDSPGSNLIIASVDKDDPRPVWVTCWGGCNTIAQAITTVKSTRSAAELTKFLSKLRVVDILGQDETGAWMTKTYPELFFVRATAVYGWQPSDQWVSTNVQSKGPLGKVYPTAKWAIEGDTPAFLYLYPNGLNDPEHVDQGSWGGRFDTTKKMGIRGMSAVSGESQYDPYGMYPNVDGTGALTRWRAGYDNDFAARMDWSIKSSYAEANHHPVAIVNGDAGRKVLEVSAAAGSELALDAAGSSDPDKNALVYSWSFYDEPSSYNGAVTIQGAATASAKVMVPTGASGKTLHIVLTLHDDGSPNLYAYRRVIIKVQ